MTTQRQAEAFKAAARWDLAVLQDAVRSDPALVRAVDKAGYTLLHRAALTWGEKIGRPSEEAKAVTDFLLDAGADLEAVRIIPDDGELFPATPVWCAASWGRNFPLVADFVRRGARTGNCLFAAVYGQDVRILEQVLIPRPCLDPVADGETPFFYAVRLRRFEAARVLAGAGADAKRANGAGETPLELARRRRYPREVIDWLAGL